MTEKLRVVELWGGPGSGKSTSAAALFARLKLRGVVGRPKLGVELVTERAKEITWDLQHVLEGRPTLEARRRALGSRQASLFAEQWARLARLVGQVDLAISDSPLALCVQYADPALYPRSPWSEVIRAHYARIEVLPVWIGRVKDYETRGRNETAEEARGVDASLRPLFEAFGGSEEVPGDEQAAARIEDLLVARGWI